MATVSARKLLLTHFGCVYRSKEQIPGRKTGGRSHPDHTKKQRKVG